MKNPFLKMAKIYSTGFRQTSDATCGPASVILTTLGFGLKEKKEADWRAPQFKKWLPIHDFQERGMALHELQFISELLFQGKIDFTLKHSYPENLSLFLEDIKVSLLKKDSVLIVNYKQDDFVFHNPPCPKGNPHYSPLIDWNKANHQVLIADVDPIIIKPYWVSIDALYQSMAALNPSFNLPRGWLKLRLR